MTIYARKLPKISCENFIEHLIFPSIDVSQVSLQAILHDFLAIFEETMRLYPNFSHILSLENVCVSEDGSRWLTAYVINN